jgi:hypothetical protein
MQNGLFCIHLPIKKSDRVWNPAALKLLANAENLIISYFNRLPRMERVSVRVAVLVALLIALFAISFPLLDLDFFPVTELATAVPTEAVTLVITAPAAALAILLKMLVVPFEFPFTLAAFSLLTFCSSIAAAWALTRTPWRKP